MKSREDALLESLLRSDALPDAGFSQRVVARIRRRLWLRRLLVPVATTLGGLVAVKPASALLISATAALLHSGVSDATAFQTVPELLAAIVPGAMLAAGLVVGLRMLED